MSFFLSILVLVIFVVLPLAHLGVLAKLFVDLGFSAVLISGAVATNRSVMLTCFIIWLTLASLVIHWIGAFNSSLQNPVLDSVLIMVLFASFILVLLLQVFRSGRTTIHRVSGAVAAYLSIGITWGYAYFVTSLFDGGAVRFSERLTLSQIPVERYIYFSFVTLTTLGYGDAVPADPVTRTLAVAEALTGQLYPAVLIAGLLGLSIQSRHAGEAQPRLPEKSELRA